MDITPLSNITRLQLLHCLAEPHSVTDLLAKCELSQSALSQHLKKLKDAGLVRCNRDGNQQIYAIATEDVLEAVNVLLNLHNTK